MSYTTEEIVNKQFDVVLRGWDKDEVRDFLAHLASEQEATLAAAEAARAGADAARSRAGELELSLAETQRALVEAREELTRRKQGPADRYVQVGQEVTAILQAAENQAERVCRQAERDAAETRTHALAAARREADEMVASVQAEVREIDRQADEMLTAARDEVDRLQAVESRLREGLEAAAVWVVRSLASPDDELGSVPSPFDPRVMAGAPKLLSAG